MSYLFPCISVRSHILNLQAVGYEASNRVGYLGSQAGVVFEQKVSIYINHSGTAVYYVCDVRDPVPVTA